MSERRRQRRIERRQAREPEHASENILTRRERMKRWFRTLNWKRKLLLGVAAAGALYVGGRHILPHLFEREVRNPISFIAHEKYSDGVFAAKDIESFHAKHPIAVIALENMHATAEQNRRFMNSIEEKRRIFETWRQNNPIPEEQLKYANILVRKGLSGEGSMALSPVLAESLFLRIPIRSLEEISPLHERQMDAMSAQMNRSYRNSVNTKTLEEGRKYIVQALTISDEYLIRRNTEMAEEYQKIRAESSGKGAVYLVAGAQHYDVANLTKTSARKNIDPENIYAEVDFETNDKLPMEIRSKREIVMQSMAAYHAQFGNVSQVPLFKRAMKRASQLSEKDYEILSQKIGQYPASRRGLLLANELGKE
mgnify:CR=1 FL=1